MAIEEYLAGWVAEAPGLIGSVIAVLLMVGVALALGFRKQTLIDEAALERLAATEGARVEGTAIAADGRQAFAKLSGSKIMVARVMGADVSARVAPRGSVHVSSRSGKLSVRFADTGFPPLHMKLQTEPAWLAELAAGERP